MFHLLHNLKITKIVNKQTFFSPNTATLCHYDKRHADKAAWGEEPLKQSLLWSVFNKKWAEDTACLLYLDTSLHISFPVQLPEKGASYSWRSEPDEQQQQWTNVWLLSSGRRLTTLSIIFTGFSLSPDEKRSWAELSKVSGGVGAFAHSTGWTFPNVTHPDYCRGG